MRALLAALALLCSACIGVRGGYAWSYDSVRRDGPYSGLWLGMSLVEPGPFAGLGGEFAVHSWIDGVKESVLLPGVYFGGVEVGRHGMLAGSLSIGGELAGDNLGLHAAACWGYYDLRATAEAFLCGRWSGAGWFGLDLSLGKLLPWASTGPDAP